MTDEVSSEILAEARARVRLPLSAAEYAGRAAESASKPQKILCGDDRILYSVKFSNNTHGDGRALVAECLSGLLGSSLGAPVAEVALIEVDQPFLVLNSIELQPGLSATPGIHHGSRWIDGCIGPSATQYVEVNRERFGSLEVLYTWFHCSNDQQFIYSAATNKVFSVDHSPFFPAGPGGWTLELLNQNHESVQADPVLGTLGLSAADRGAALAALANLTPLDIAIAVATPPNEWGLDDQDRLGLLSYLVRRKDAVLELLG